MKTNISALVALSAVLGLGLGFRCSDDTTEKHCYEIEWTLPDGTSVEGFRVLSEAHAEKLASLGWDVERAGAGRCK